MTIEVPLWRYRELKEFQCLLLSDTAYLNDKGFKGLSPCDASKPVMVFRPYTGPTCMSGGVGLE